MPTRPAGGLASRPNLHRSEHYLQQDRYQNAREFEEVFHGRGRAGPRAGGVGATSTGSCCRRIEAQAVWKTCVEWHMCANDGFQYRVATLPLRKGLDMRVKRLSMLSVVAAAGAIALSTIVASPASAEYTSAWKTQNCSPTTQASVYSETNTTGWHQYSGANWSGTVYIGSGAQRTYGYVGNGQWRHFFYGIQGWASASCRSI